jgi:hypothetical protein
MVDPEHVPYPESRRREGKHLTQREEINKKEMHLGQNSPATSDTQDVHALQHTAQVERW